MIEGASKPRLLYLTSNDALGGMERCVVNLSREFRLRDWRVTPVFVRGTAGARFLTWCQEQGVRARTSDAVLYQEAHRGPAEMRKLHRLVRRMRPLVTHLHYGANYLSLKDAIAVRTAGAHYAVASVHNAVPWTAENEHQRRRTRLAGMLYDALIVNADVTRNVLLDAGVPAHKIHLVRYGLYPPANAPDRSAARTRLGIRPDAFVVTTNGRLVPHKGAADLITAAARVPDPHKQLVLLIAGEGPERDALKALAERVLPDQVRFLGHVARHDDLYAASDVFSLPSHDARESFGMVFIEAAFHGVPSIGARAGGIPEAVIEDVTGLLVPPRSPAALAEAIRRLRDQPGLRERLGNAARERAYAEFTASHMTAGYERVYRDGLQHAKWRRLAQPGSLRSYHMPARLRIG